MSTPINRYIRTGPLGNQNTYDGGYVIDDVAIPAGALTDEGDALDVEVCFKTAANGSGGKRFNLYVLGTVVYDSGTWGGNSHASYLKCKIVKTNTSKVRVHGFVTSESAGREKVIDFLVTPDPAQNKLQIVAIGTSALNDTLVTMTSVVELPTP